MDNREKMMQRYVATKRIEGLSENTIQRYIDVAAILGHADLKTTKIYCYTSQSKVKREYRKYSL